MGVHSKLAHLNDEQIKSLVDEYYDSDIRVEDLIKKYEIPIKGNNLVSLLPAEQTDTPCPWCSQFMARERVSRSQNSYLPKTGELFCDGCGHRASRPYGPKCACQNCAQHRRKEALRLQSLKEDLLSDFYSDFLHEPICLENLSLRDQVYLAALIRSGWSADDGCVHGSNLLKSETPIASSINRTMGIVNALIDKRVILPVGTCSEKAVEFKLSEYHEPVAIECWYPLHFRYEINIEGVTNPADEVALSYLPDDILIRPEENVEAALVLWREAAEDECAAYLEERCEKLRLAFEMTEKGRGHISKALEWFSVGQVRNLIWRSTKDVLRYITEHNIHRGQQKNLPAKFLLTASERAKANEWEIKPYAPPQNRPAVVDVIAHQLLKLGDSWETEIICREVLVAESPQTSSTGT